MVDGKGQGLFTLSALKAVQFVQPLLPGYFWPCCSKTTAAVFRALLLCKIEPPKSAHIINNEQAAPCLIFSSDHSFTVFQQLMTDEE